MAIHAHALSVHVALMNTTSELESQFAAIIINIHLGRAARVESCQDKGGIQFKGILMSRLFEGRFDPVDRCWRL